MIYACTKCRAQYVGPYARCPSCGRHGTIQLKKSLLATSGPTKVEDIDTSTKEHRNPTGTREFDRVLGGGIVQNSIILLSGEPGQGKSTLAHTVAAELADGVEEGEEAKDDPFKAVLITGEETKEQVADRGKRICHDSKKLEIAVEDDAEEIIKILEKLQPDLAIIDSVQKVRVRGESGTPASIREATNMLVQACKTRGIVGSLILIAHVTKDGTIAGPKYLEHMVDVVLLFDSENRSASIRTLRALKNRFGPTSYVGVFRMTKEGLQSEDDPSKFLMRKRLGPPGSSVGCAMVKAGGGDASSKPMLVEVQALIVPVGTPRGAKVSSVGGYSEKRLSMMLAILESLKIESLALNDVYLNVPCALEVEDESALDLAVIAALLSAYRKKPLPAGAVFWGEVGLLGELRYEGEIESRKGICERMKFGRMYFSEEENVLNVGQIVDDIFK